MTKEPHYSSFTAPILLAAALLQACVGGNTIPKVLSVKTPAEAPSSTASTKVISSAAQPEGKHDSAQQSRNQTTTPQHLAHAAPMLQSTASSRGDIADKKASPALSFISKQPQPIVLERDYPERFKPGAISPHHHAQGNYPLATEHKKPLDHITAKFASDKLQSADSKNRQPPLPSIESLLKRLQNIDIHDLMAYADCLKAIAKTTSPASAKRVQNALEKAYHRLHGTRKDVRDPVVLKHTLKVIETAQADLAHFQRIIGEEAPATSSTCFPTCGCCEETFTVDFERVDRVVRHYPAMAAIVVPVVLGSHSASLIRSVSKDKFIHDCLMAYPQHTPALLSIIHTALKNIKIDEFVLRLRCTETKIVDVLASFIEKNPEYVEDGIHILNTAFCNQHQQVSITALQAFARMLCVRPQCRQYVNKGKLYQAFRGLQSALKEPESAIKMLAQDTLEVLEKCNTPFLRKGWHHYVRTRNINRP